MKNRQIKYLVFIVFSFCISCRENAENYSSETFLGNFSGTLKERTTFKYSGEVLTHEEDVTFKFTKGNAEDIVLMDDGWIIGKVTSMNKVTFNEQILSIGIFDDLHVTGFAIIDGDLINIRLDCENDDVIKRYDISGIKN